MAAAKNTVVYINRFRGSSGERRFIEAHPLPHMPDWRTVHAFRTEVEYRKQRTEAARK